MPKNNSITLGDHFNDFISEEKETGSFGTASEVVRAGMRLLALEEKKLAALRSAIDEGDASPDAKGNAFARVRKTLKLKRRRG